jgi:hypothetical protein
MALYIPQQRVTENTFISFVCWLYFHDSVSTLQLSVCPIRHFDYKSIILLWISFACVANSDDKYVLPSLDTEVMCLFKTITVFRRRYCPLYSFRKVDCFIGETDLLLSYDLFFKSGQKTTASFCLHPVWMTGRGQGHHRRASLQFSEDVNFVFTWVAVVAVIIYLRKGAARP